METTARHDARTRGESARHRQRIDWKKKGADGVFLFARLLGQPAWMKIGMDTNSPYIDGRPLATAGVPETREYMLRGMLNDAEIGVDSDTMSITWNGQ